MALYQNTEAVVLSADGETETSDTSAGVPQSDTPTPYLFVIVLGCAMRTATGEVDAVLGYITTPRQSRRHPAKVLTDTKFARKTSLTVVVIL